MVEDRLIYLAAKRYADRVLKFDLNVLIGVFGEPGSGKSSFAIRLGEILRDKYGLDFSVDNVFFDPVSFLNGLTGRHKVVILDETGVALDARKFGSTVNVALTQALQTVRFKNSVIIFVSPNISFIDKRVRRLIMHAWHIRAHIVNGEVVRTAQPYVFVSDPLKDKTTVEVATYINSKGRSLHFPEMPFSKPSDDLWQEYLKKKQQWFEAWRRRWSKDVAKKLGIPIENKPAKELIFEFLEENPQHLRTLLEVKELEQKLAQATDEEERQKLKKELKRKKNEKRKIVLEIVKRFGVSEVHAYRVINEAILEISNKHSKSYDFVSTSQSVTEILEK